MTVEGNEKINVNYQLKWLPTYAPYEPVLPSHSSSCGYEGIASHPLVSAVSLLDRQPFARQHSSYSQERESNLSDYLDCHTDHTNWIFITRTFTFSA